MELEGDIKRRNKFFALIKSVMYYKLPSAREASLKKIKLMLDAHPNLLNAQLEGSKDTPWMMAFFSGDEDLIWLFFVHINDDTNFLLEDYNGRTGYQYLLHYTSHETDIYVLLMREWIKRGILLQLLEKDQWCYVFPERNPNMHRAIALYRMINQHTLVLPPEMMVMLTTCLSQFPENDLIRVKKLFYD